MRGHLALLTALLVALPACGSRERANPLDPRNPATGGRPSGFVALAGNGHVRLQWSRGNVSGLAGYQLSRRIEGQGAYAPLAELPALHTTYDDFGLANGVEHHYRLAYLFTSGPGPRPAEDSAIPGPLVPWATDLGGRSLLTLTADGRHVESVDARFGGPTHVAVDATEGRVWVSDTYGGALAVYDLLSPAPVTLPGFVEPTSIAVDPVSHHAWICDEGSGLVHHRAPDGTPGTPATVGPLGLPIAVAVSPRDRSVWIAENGALLVRHLDAAGGLIAASPVARPSRLAVDSTSGDAWGTSFESGQVFQVSPGGSVVRTLPGFGGPIGIAVDWRRDRVWIADALAGQIVALRRNGTQVLRVTGLPQVREVAVDLASGRCWATVPGVGQIVSITPEGAIASRISGVTGAYAIALDPGLDARHPLARSARLRAAARGQKL
jgi:DNA-binding beta-propeller fold protein YncE